ncbi:MAG TPA: ferredoxin [Acidimicrobiales bacterium]|nr:ferredoxin [Acidimicrobiales bacterium]
MRVWIEQDYCTGDGLCEELCPEVFQMGDDGLAHVREELAAAGEALGREVPAESEAGVLDAQAQCAGECIYIAR